MRSTITLLLLLAALPLSGRELPIRPAPSWVERVTVDTRLHVPKENVRWGLYDLLNDHQVRAGASASHYYRTVRKVLSPSGVQNASELSLDFDPTFERLTIHEVKVFRDGVALDAFEPDEVRVIDKEDNTDARIYDGEQTALIFIRDVRPGDVLDYSWSLDGANPLLGGKYVDELDLSSAVPAKQIRHRLLWPLGRPLAWRGAEPEITVSGSEQSYVWQRENVAALDVEDSLPSWFEPWESVQLSEFASWSEVARWADAMFRLDARSTEAVKALAATFAKQPTPEARATAAIRFVQDEIRYLGIEMGRNSHEPHQPWETLAQRWGDCKDKTLLLVALLRELGFEAHPALVNTKLQHRLGEKLPSPFLFDHVIAQVIAGGRAYYIDGTISEQGGALTSIETPNDGLSLIVRPDTSALTKVSTNARGNVHVEQTYTTTDFQQPVALELKTTYSGSDADAMRGYLASLSVDDYAKERINELASDQPKIQANGAPRIHDDRAKNVLSVTERYLVPELWAEGEWTWYPRVLEAHFRRPETMIRTMPMAFEWPLDVTQSVTFTFPEEVNVDKSTAVTETSTFRYEYTVDSNGRTVMIRQSLRSLKDSIDVKDVADHLTKLNGIWGEIGYRLAPTGAQPKPAAKPRSSASKWGWGFALVAAFVGICSLIAIPRMRGTKIAEIMFRPGEAPASALAIRHDGDIGTHLAALACPCGASIDAAPEMQRARYAERELTIVTRQCATCGREQSVYFTAA